MQLGISEGVDRRRDPAKGWQRRFRCRARPLNDELAFDINYAAADRDDNRLTRNALTWTNVGALGVIRTRDTRFRKPMLYPLSYEG